MTEKKTINPKQKRMEEVDKEVEKLDEAIANTRAELKDLKAGWAELNKDLEQKVDDLWTELPASTPKGILDKLYKTATPKRGQLQENISKLEVSLNLLGNKKGKLLLEKRTIEKAMREDKLNEQTTQACITLKHCIDEYLKFENLFFQFKEQAGNLREIDNGCSNRVDMKRFSEFYVQVLGLSLISPGRLSGLTPMGFITGIQEVGTENENPLKNPMRYQREERKENIIHELGGENPQLNDRQIEYEIGEAFENPTLTEY